MGKNSNSGNQHITPRGNQWAVLGAGNNRATAIVNTQREAINIAKPIATNQGGDVIIPGIVLSGILIIVVKLSSLYILVII